MRIGVDIDGVCYQWDKTARYMLREILPMSPYTKDGPLGQPSAHWDHIQEMVVPEHWDWLWTEGVKLGLFRHGHLFPGTIEAIRKLSELGDVVAITHRPKSAVMDTLAWLAFQDLPLAGLHLLTGQEPKSTVKPECDIYIDDKFLNCVDLANNTNCRAVICMMRQWSFPTRHVDIHTRGVIHMARDWPTAIDKIQEVK